MRIKEKNFNLILYIIYNFIIISMGFIHMKMLYSDELVKLPIISKLNFGITFSVLLSLMSLILVIKKIMKYKQLKNQTINIYIDTKAAKKRVIYMFLGADIFVILIVIGLNNVFGMIILTNAIIWNILGALWVKFDDGIYNNILFYKDSVYPLEQIDECLINKETIELTVIDKILFFEVIRNIELESNSKEIDKLILMLDKDGVKIEQVSTK